MMTTHAQTPDNIAQTPDIVFLKPRYRKAFSD
ncbi:hypothetical protein NIES4071_103980 (plasmid) [Calothrix sp. NIES-4071]|nr:hypothetical protein NIES4071_103980 [Calothrix sp. NIES-4071]BAZ64385.1 hypothetical protein NIES4105_101180 [Calothrix sp. NIES-4105]